MALGDEPPTGGDTKDKKDERHKQTIIVITAIIGVLLTYLLYRKSQASSAAALAATPVSDTTADTGADTSDQDSTAQTGMLNNIYAALTNLPAQIAAAIPGTTAATTTKTASSSFLTSGAGATFTTPGSLNQHVSLRAIAQELAGPNATANEVESYLEKLVAQNPSLKNQTYVLGGHALTLPTGTSVYQSTTPHQSVMVHPASTTAPVKKS